MASSNPTPQVTAVVGCGTIGSSWAALFSLHGHRVVMLDVSEEATLAGRDRALGLIDSVVAHDLYSAEVAERARQLLEPASEPSALSDAMFVQESVLETYESKGPMHALIEEHVDASATIVSSSSSLLPSRMQQSLQHPGRFLLAHPFNPPHLVPLVELVPGTATDAAVMESTVQFYEAMGKIAVVLKKEALGYIGNRLAAALWREAVHLVDEGVATVEDVDKALYAGPGLRFALMGQHLIYHLGGGRGGYREFFEKLVPTAGEPIIADLAKWETVPDSARQAVIDGIDEFVDGKSMEQLEADRDARLVRLLKALYPKEGT
jgi:3-hydroxybutyryl-CoA dehydrogenase